MKAPKVKPEFVENTTATGPLASANQQQQAAAAAAAAPLSHAAATMSAMDNPSASDANVLRQLPQHAGGSAPCHVTCDV